MNENLIFDVGMHTGRDTEFYLKKGFNVIGVEANPELVKSNLSKFNEYLSDGRLIICDYAIADYEGEVQFYVNNLHDDWGTISEDFASRNEKIGTMNSIIQVKCQPFINILSKYGVPYYLKIDIEGADMLCIKDLYSLPEKPRYVSIEAGLNSFNETFSELSLLWNLGYRSFKIVNQAVNKDIVCPHPPLEGDFVDYHFDGTCSGLFGEETLGRWLNIEETLTEYKKLLWESKYFGANGKLYRSIFHKAYTVLKREPVGWYDFHAKLADI
jgi:FkbM family methyltransferase